MKILYRPHRGSLAEAMLEVKEFETLKDLVSWLVKEHSVNGKAFNEEEIHFKYYCYDKRIDWETFIVTTERYGETKFSTPQAIGFMCMKGTQEYKHGYWKAKRSPADVFYSCSECRCTYCYADPEIECEYNYCPNCGAKMDLKGGAD